MVRNLAAVDPVVEPVADPVDPAAGPAAGVPEAAPLGRRERNRLARHRSYLAAAQDIVGRDGLDALTMQRVADHLDCAVGTIYTYFPSKGALLAELQRSAIERLTSSYLIMRTDTDRLLEADEPSERVRAVARLVAMGRFWAATTETFPREAHLMQMLMTAGQEIMAVDDSERVLPAATRHLDLARVLLEDAAAAGVIRTADAWSRVVTWLAAVNGVVQVSRLAMWDEDLLDGVRLSADLNQALLLGWGADPEVLRQASDHIDRLAKRGPLAPPVPEENP